MNEKQEDPGVKYEFGEFVLDPQERILFSNGVRAHLTDKVFDTLLVLVRRNGQLVTEGRKDVFHMGESFFEEGNLAKHISRLRKILKINGGELIGTLPRRGYRFRADIKRVAREPHTIAVLPFQPLKGKAD